MHSKRYWLRGGFIFLVLGILILLSQFLTGCVDCSMTIADRVLYVAVLPIISLINPIVQIEDGWLALVFPAYFFLLGAILGWLYGKIKSRNSISM